METEGKQQEVTLSEFPYLDAAKRGANLPEPTHQLVVGHHTRSKTPVPASEGLVAGACLNLAAAMLEAEGIRRRGGGDVSSAEADMLEYDAMLFMIDAEKYQLEEERLRASRYERKRQGYWDYWDYLDY